MKEIKPSTPPKRDIVVEDKGLPAPTQTIPMPAVKPPKPSKTSGG